MAVFEDRVEEILAQKPKVVKIEWGPKMAVYDLSGEPGVYLGTRVFERHKVDFCLVRYCKDQWQLLSVPEPIYDLTGLIVPLTVGYVRLRISGHAHLVLIQTEGSTVPENVHDLVVSVAEYYLSDNYRYTHPPRVIRWT